MRIENREDLNQLREQANQVIGLSKCRILIWMSCRRFR